MNGKTERGKEGQGEQGQRDREEKEQERQPERQTQKRKTETVTQKDKGKDRELTQTAETGTQREVHRDSPRKTRDSEKPGEMENEVSKTAWGQRERERQVDTDTQKGRQRGKGRGLQGGGIPAQTFSWFPEVGKWEQVKWHGLPRQSLGSSVAMETATTALSSPTP